jgi:hypothetical protein
MSLITGCAAVTGSDLRSSRLSLAKGALCGFLAPVFYGHPWHVVSETYLIDSTVVRSNECFGMPFLAAAEVSVRQCLCRADNRPDSLSLQRGQGTVGARSPPIPKSAETLPKMLPVADRSSLVLRVEQAEGPYPPSLPRGAARPVGVLLTRPS